MNSSQRVNLYLKISPSVLAAYILPTQLRIERKDRIALLKKHALPILVEARKHLLIQFESDATALKWDDLYLLSHLRMLEKYSEFQWEYALAKQKNKSLNLAYASDFLSLLIATLSTTQEGLDLLNLMDQELVSKVTEIDGDVLILNRAFDNVMNDEPKTLDGLTFPQFRSVMYVGSTIADLRKLAEKYHVNVPTYISKLEIQRRLKDALLKTGTLTIEKQQRLETASIRQLTELGEEWKLNAKTYMTKEEIIEYILEHAEPTRKDYEKPVDSNVYYQETIQGFQRDYQSLLSLTLSTVNLKDKALLEQALRRISELEEQVQSQLVREKELLEALLKHLQQPVIVSPVLPQPPPPATLPNPVVVPPSSNTYISQASLPTPSSVDLKPYLDRIDQSLATQHQLLQIIQQLMAQSKPTPNTNTVIKTSSTWYENISLVDVILGVVLFLQIIWILVVLF